MGASRLHLAPLSSSMRSGKARQASLGVLRCAVAGISRSVYHDASTSVQELLQ